MLDLNTRQVLKALEEPTALKKSTGRPPTLDKEQHQQLIDFVYALRKPADDIRNWQTSFSFGI
jgi:hypothetical protein